MPFDRNYHYVLLYCRIINTHAFLLLKNYQLSSYVLLLLDS